jgi:hypothetical protein
MTGTMIRVVTVLPLKVCGMVVLAVVALFGAALNESDHRKDYDGDSDVGQGPPSVKPLAYGHAMTSWW